MSAYSAAGNVHWASSGRVLDTRHPRLFKYDPELIDATVRAGDPAAILREEAEQIYAFRLFTPEFCRLLVEEAEHRGCWETGEWKEDNPNAPDIKEVSLADTTQHLESMGLERVYEEVVRRHVVPLVNHVWPVFKVQKIDPPYVLKYDADAIRTMDLHYDLETVTLVVYLNDEFEGGGTYFPRWRYSTGKRAPGSAIMYPGGLSHVHEGLPITSGRRYLLCGAFY